MASTTEAGFTVRESRSRAAGDPIVEAVLDGDTFPFIQAVYLDDSDGDRPRWLLFVGGELQSAAGMGYHFMPTVTITGGEAVRGEVRTWVEMLARLHAKAVAQ